MATTAVSSAASVAAPSAVATTAAVTATSLKARIGAALSGAWANIAAAAAVAGKFVVTHKVAFIGGTSVVVVLVVAYLLYKNFGPAASDASDKKPPANPPATSTSGPTNTDKSLIDVKDPNKNKQ